LSPIKKSPLKFKESNLVEMFTHKSNTQNDKNENDEDLENSLSSVSLVENTDEKIQNKDISLEKNSASNTPTKY